MSPIDRKAVALKCCVQTYAWGKPGSQSTVAKLAQNDSSFNVDETTTYAEVRNMYNYNNIKIKTSNSNIFVIPNECE